MASLCCKKRREGRGRYHGDREAEGEGGRRRSASYWWRGRRLPRRRRRGRERRTGWAERDAGNETFPLATAPEGRGSLCRQGDGWGGGALQLEWRENVQRNRLQEHFKKLLVYKVFNNINK